MVSGGVEQYENKNKQTNKQKEKSYEALSAVNTMALQNLGIVPGRCVCATKQVDRTSAFVCFCFNTRHCCFHPTTTHFPSPLIGFIRTGTQTAVFFVDIVDNWDADTDRMFSLRLDSVTGQGAVLGSPSEITITILEDGRLRPALDSVFCQSRGIKQLKVTKQREERQAGEKEKNISGANDGPANIARGSVFEHIRTSVHNQVQVQTDNSFVLQMS